MEIEEPLPAEHAKRLGLTPKKYRLGTVLSIYGSDTGWNRFKELGRRAGNCVRGRIPWELPPDREPSGFYPELLWIAALFGLAWQRRPGVDLHASVDRFAGLCPVPESFVSLLSDAFTASVVAIDCLLAENRKSSGEVAGDGLQDLPCVLEGDEKGAKDPPKRLPVSAKTTAQPVADQPQLSHSGPERSPGRVGEWFDEDPPADSRFKNGPLEGSVRQLARWMGMDQRTLKKQNGRTSWWIRRIHGKKYSAWFATQQKFAQANEKRLVETAQNDTK